MTPLRPRLAWLPLALAAACGSGSGDGQNNSGDAGVDSGGAESGETDAAAGVDASDGGTGDALLGCAEASAGLALKLHAMQGAQCTVVVRLDFQSLAVLGYQVICGPAATVSEAQARATAAADTGFGGDASAAPALNPANPGDAFVFYQVPSDLGGAAAVSARTGLTVFGGGVVRAGRGEITYPTSWRPAAELGAGCAPADGIPSPRPYSVGAPVSDPTVAAAVAAVAQTAVPSAIWRSGQITGAVALGYARSVGLVTADGGTSAGDEWIILVNSE
ncbi:MAG TPA: hypothetical protein VMU50_13195 [Polyangia bacterium]|nr:hypothetical protein [Polyangia bacterium]